MRSATNVSMYSQQQQLPSDRVGSSLGPLAGLSTAVDGRGAMSAVREERHHEIKLSGKGVVRIETLE